MCIDAFLKFGAHLSIKCFILYLSGDVNSPSINEVILQHGVDYVSIHGLYQYRVHTSKHPVNILISAKDPILLISIFKLKMREFNPEVFVCRPFG